MEEEGRVAGSVGILSGLSALSLIAFGGLSLLVVLFSWSWSGALVGAALLVHGFLEHRWRALFLVAGESLYGKRLAWNQIALGGSVLLYLSWQALAFDRTEWDAMFSRDPLRSLLQQMPPDVVEMLNRDFPKLLVGAYGVAGLVVAVGCLGMALMYLKTVKE